MKMINVTKWAVVIACIGFMAFTVQSTKADIFTFNLTNGNSAISGYPGPYASVLVNRVTTTTATITFASLINSGNIYLFGDGSTGAVNVNAASWTLGTIIGLNAGIGFSPGPFSDAGSQNVDGFGGFTHSSDSVTFTLTDTSGTWISAANVLTPNSHGILAAAHIFVTEFP